MENSNIITVNTYDAAGRFDMTDEQAEQFYQHVEKKAVAAGYETRRECAIAVDEESERFVEKCFAEYEPE